MTTLAELKAQQTEIRELTKALLALLTPEQQAVGTIQRVTHTLLCDLCEKVDHHLAEEHKGVFPTLLSHGDQNVQNMVWGFINNDKPLRNDFQKYKHKWLRDCEYAVSHDFLTATKEVLELLEERLALEESSMIPKLEKTGLLAQA